jgi:4-hydroxybenzoate polyprenyltransferase
MRTRRWAGVRAHDATAQPFAMRAAARVTAREPLGRRWLRYQAERFPLAGYVPLIAAFTFASAAYSRLARRAAGMPGAEGFVPWPRYVVGTLTSLTFFLVLRILDEHKDADVDARYRPELPVPRGVIALGELRAIGGAALVVVLALNAWVAPVLLLPCALVAGWAFLMTKEFFVRDWLRAHLLAYLVTHMMIMPMIDAYTTGLDWLVDAHAAPPGLPWFLAITLANGSLVEIGRKLRAPADERPGVDTYTRAWGVVVAPLAWLGLLAASALLGWRAATFTGAAHATALVLVPAALLLGAPGALFLATRRGRFARACEVASGLWAIVTYLTLGAGPFVVRALEARP